MNPLFDNVSFELALSDAADTGTPLFIRHNPKKFEGARNRVELQLRKASDEQVMEYVQRQEAVLRRMNTCDYGDLRNYGAQLRRVNMLCQLAGLERSELN